jgi:hypothetical protein
MKAALKLKVKPAKRKEKLITYVTIYNKNRDTMNSKDS